MPGVAPKGFLCSRNGPITGGDTHSGGMTSHT